jgi:DNA-binding MarR family transcriptional regulator
VQSSTATSLKSYLETLSGVSPHLRPLQVAQLPLFLRNRFSFYSVELFGKPWCLAQEDESWDTGSPGEYEKQAQTLRPLLKAPVVFVLSALPSNARNRMVQKGIPFIVPGTQAFLPSALVDLRERFPKPSQKGRTSLSPTAQLAILYHLEREPLSRLPLRSIAEKLHCSAMMLSKVKDELEEAGICEVERIGRSMALKFSAANRALWNLTQNRLTSPVKKTRWVHWKTPGYPALLSGISALSRRTMLADDRVPTYALGPKVLESWLERGTLTGCPDAELATAKIEVWSYEPKLLGDNEAVDPLSLYLSLRYNADERVQQQLEQLIEEVQW